MNNNWVGYYLLILPFISYLFLILEAINAKIYFSEIAININLLFLLTFRRLAYFLTDCFF